jgi:glycyl-tRNA synthetase beta chain
MADYLLEIFVEDIPPVHLRMGLKQLEEKIKDALEKNRIDYEKLLIKGTKRRFSIIIKNIAEIQKEEEITIIGPSKHIAFDEEGNPTQAAMGFVKSKGKTIDDLSFLETPRGEYIAIKEIEKGKESRELIKEFIPNILSSLSFPKNMKWNKTETLFTRPIRSIVSILDNDIIEFEFAGIIASNKTKGHLILSDFANIIIDNPTEYELKLKEKQVILDREERKRIIFEEIKEIENIYELEIVENEDLLEELTDMVEYPFVFSGTFAYDYLQIPKEIIETFLKREKRLFLMKNSDSIINRFIGIADAYKEASDNIVEGFERVVKATLEDASFFWHNDLKLDFEELVEQLKTYSFGEKLGTYYEKTLRLIDLSEFISNIISSDKTKDIVRAARYSKIDQLTEMVKEFPSLQGIMGGLYLKEKGEPEQVWEAVYQQYKPVNIDDSIPESMTGKILSLVDRIDTLVGAFIVGMESSGDKDPFGLRRVGNTIIKIIIEGNLDIDLFPIISKSLELYIVEKDKKEKIQTDIIDFLIQRFRFYCSEFKGIEYDILNAVLSSDFSNILLSYRKTDALKKAKYNENFKKLIISYKRVKNIIKDNKSDELKTEMFEDSEEKELWEVFEAVKEEVEQHINNKNYMRAQESLIVLRPFIDKYFDSVLVMAKDEALKNNRISMLNRISSLFEMIADYSEIVI